MFDLIGKFIRRYRKIGNPVTTCALIFVLSFTPVYGVAQNNTEHSSQEHEIQNKVANTPEIRNEYREYKLPLTSGFEDDISGPTANILYFLSSEVYKAIYHKLEIEFWQPLKNKVGGIYGYAAISIPRVANNLKEAFRHPLASNENVTIVTTFLGVASTITSFTLGKIGAHNSSASDLVVTAVSLFALAVIYRAQFDSLGTFLNYKGWGLASIKKNNKLREIYEENLKKGIDEMPAGLNEDSFMSRLAKLLLIEIFFLGVVEGKEILFPAVKQSSEVAIRFWEATAAYTLFSFYEAILTRFLLKAKSEVVGSSPEEIEYKRNKVSMAYKVSSIGISFMQNITVMFAMAGAHVPGSNMALYGLFGAGLLLIGYEYHASLNKKSKVQVLSCSGHFAN